MDQSSSARDLTDAEYAALADQLGGQEELTVEFAVVYHSRGELVVEGPFARSLAERKAKDNHGVIAERTKQTIYGLWTSADPRLAEFDKTTEEN